MKKNLSMAAVIIAAMTTSVAAQGYGELPPAPPRPTARLQPTIDAVDTGGRSRGPYGAQAPQFSPLRQALDTYYTAKSVDEKNAAAKTIQESLSKEFDADLKKRQADLDAIRKRVEEMEASLKKRQANRQAIIDLRKQVLLNESEGLGWSGAGNRKDWLGLQSLPPAPATYWTPPPAFAPPAATPPSRK